MLANLFCQYFFGNLPTLNVDVTYFYLYNDEKERNFSMNERIKTLRKTLKLTQQEFADKLGIARGNIGAYEVGKNAPSDAVISLICSKFNVSEEWIRTGEGEMFITLSRNELIADFMTDTLKDEDENFKKRLVEALARLDASDWEDLARIAMKIIKKD